ncbi:hypothetical protein [Phenylobacterium sp.]|uniref:hypothetical protein n=1 Tax=Phenylobacterium sp. TaxID=1871053 RepID=UPI002F957DFF
MGLSIAWIAVKGVTPETVMETLGVERSSAGRRQQAQVGELAGGWTLYVDPHFERGFREPLDRLAALGAALVACRQEEHVMYAEARGYEGGRELWRVVRDSEQEPYMHLAVTGEPPPQFASMRAKAFAEQEGEGGEDADVDLLYEVPLDLARSICGFKTDEDWPDLSPVSAVGSAKGGGFFARLFGKR